MALQYQRTPASNDGGSAGNHFDLCDSLTASMGVALIILLLFGLAGVLSRDKAVG